MFRWTVDTWFVRIRLVHIVIIGGQRFTDGWRDITQKWIRDKTWVLHIGDGVGRIIEGDFVIGAIKKKIG